MNINCSKIISSNKIISGSYKNEITGNYNTIEGCHNEITGDCNKLDVYYSKIKGDRNEVKGSYNKTIGDRNIIHGSYNNIEGNNNIIFGNYSEIKGDNNINLCIYNEKGNKEELDKFINIIVTTKNFTVEEKAECKICMKNAKNTLLQPCKHVICSICANNVLKCPFCRTEIKNKIDMFI